MHSEDKKFLKKRIITNIARAPWKIMDKRMEVKHMEGDNYLLLHVKEADSGMTTFKIQITEMQ